MGLYKLTIKEIEEHLIHVTPVFGIPSFKDILRIHVNESYFRVMSTLIRQALTTFEKKIPLYMTSTVFVKGESYEFTDNFESYLNGSIDEKYLTVIPEKVINITGSLLYQARTFEYVKPRLMFFAAPIDATVLVYYMARRPLRLNKAETEDEFDEKSCIYGFNLYNDYETEQFLKELQFHLIKYMLELKTQVNYTELPIEIFSGLQDKKSELDQELEQFYLSPSLYAKLWK